MWQVTFVTDFEKLLTSSKYEAKLVTRLSIAQILNAITPIFVISKSNLCARFCFACASTWRSAFGFAEAEDVVCSVCADMTVVG